MTSTRRVPLANNPNAANSPFRTHTLNVKRQRPTTTDLHDEDAVQPPQKRQAVDVSGNVARRPANIDEHDLFMPGVKKDNKPMPDFQRRLAGVKEASRSHAKAQAQAPAQDKSHADAETVRQWRKHYRKVFPTFVFYFESLDSAVARKVSRQVATLGAREEKFFSKAITHVVTSRPIPADSTPAESRQPPSRTINPSLLDKASDAHRSRHVLDVAAQRQGQAQAGSTDVLVKAREMNIKIWALEKFDRMMYTIFDETQQDPDDAPRQRKAVKETDLAQLLKNERDSRPAQVAPWQEIIPFKGYYIYIHDVDEKVKPVMMREYNKVSAREEGEWPMFRSVSSGRCPFVEEPPTETKEDRARRKLKEQQRAEQERRRQQISVAARTRSATRSPQKVPLQVTESTGNQMAKPPMPTASTFEAPKMLNPVSGNVDSMPAMLGSTRANFQGIARNPGGEPAASGVQRNVTSAIRSQMISSTAAAPGGGRVGTSKEMHQLQRRVFEQRTGSNLSAQNSMGSSYMNDVRAAINNDSRRTARRQDGNTLGRIHEDEAESSQESQEKPPVTRKRAAAKRERDPKPGYCENCRDKYDDFLEHVDSKKHQKFALSNDNFRDLDTLLAKLARR